MTVPTIFIVGAPRCGTSSLWDYLAAHPQVFMPKEKEPHHFGSDLGLRRRPYGDRDRYLELFEPAGPHRQAGEASVLYLYSRTAPREIQELSPTARIIIMLRDPLEMVRSLHAHNRFLLYEDLPDVDAALDAEADRGEGRRLPGTCVAPLALQYRALARYSEHVQRYREVFGPDRVKCIFFEDFKKDTAKVYAETLAFLGLESIAKPEFKTQNAVQSWRSQRVARVVVPTFLRGCTLALALPRGVLRTAALVVMALVCYPPMRLNVRAEQPPPLSPDAADRLRRDLKEDVDRLGTLLGRDLSSWLAPARPASPAPEAAPSLASQGSGSV